MTISQIILFSFAGAVMARLGWHVGGRVLSMVEKIWRAWCIGSTPGLSPGEGRSNRSPASNFKSC